MVSFKKGGCVVLFGILGLALGCGGGNVVPVSGTLTYKGKPVTNAYVHFVPDQGRPSMGETDPQGNFVLTYDPQKKGAQLGKHKVWVQHNPLADTGEPGALPGQPAPLKTEIKQLFDKYSQTNSKVEVTIDKSVSNLKLDLD